MFSKLGLGTWGFGGYTQPDPDNNDAADITSIQNAINSGIKHIDTAALYAAGKTEELVGQAIKPYNREDLFIASKALSASLSYDGVMQTFEASMKRLKLDYLDLYYVHKPNPEFSIAETTRAFNRLLQQGLIKNIGICNANVNTMKKYQSNLDCPIFASQCHYNLIVREPERSGLLDYCKQNNIHFIAWRPIQLPAPSLGIEPFYKREFYPLLDQMADKYGKSNAQIAIRWLTQQDNVNTIFKTSNPQHLSEIIESSNFKISSEDMRNLADNFPIQRNEGFVSSGETCSLI